MKRRWLNQPMVVIPVALAIFVLAMCPRTTLAVPSASTNAAAQQYLDQRQHNEALVREFLAEQPVREKLAKMGLKPQEIDARLNELSDAQVQELAAQIDKAKSGGYHVELAIIAVVAVIALLFWLFTFEHHHAHRVPAP